MDGQVLHGAVCLYKTALFDNNNNNNNNNDN